MKKIFCRLITISILINFLVGNAFAKTNNITVDFTTRSLVNNHFSFIAAVTSSSPVTNYFWDFGDGVNSGWQSSDIANHTYTATGTYLVKLVAQNSAGERDSIVKIINAYKHSRGTDADFSISPEMNIYTGDTVQFTNTSVSTAGPATAEWWNFGNSGSAGSVESPSHVFMQPGLYSIYLTVGNPVTGIDTTLKTIRVLQGGVVADFSFPAGQLCQHEAVQFVDASISGPGNIVSWNWEFGDGTTSTLQNPSYTFSTGANYIVKLIVTNNVGLRDTISKNIHITKRTSANFGYSPAIIYAGGSIQLSDSSIANCGSIAEWEWQCHGVSPANDSFVWDSIVNSPPLIVLPDSGKYEITLRANEDTVSKIIEVYPFELRSLCPGDTIKLPAFKTGSTYQWQESRNNGLSYMNIDHTLYYSGFTTDTLTVKSAPSFFNGFLYRCLVDGRPVVLYKLGITNQFVGSGDWENIGNWHCNSLPDQYTDVVISSGVVTINSNVICHSLTVSSGASVVVSPGFNLTVLH